MTKCSPRLQVRGPNLFDRTFILETSGTLLKLKTTTSNKERTEKKGKSELRNYMTVSVMVYVLCSC